MSSIQKISLSLSIIIIGFFAAVVFHYSQGVYENSGYPRNTFLFMPDDHFADFGGLKIMTGMLDPFHTTYRDQGTNYPPGGYLIAVPYTLWQEDFGRFLFAATFIVALMALFAFYLPMSSLPLGRIPSFLILGLMTYPTLFVLDRMNSEMIIFSLCAVFFILCLRGRWKTGAIFLGIAGSAKLYPLAFLMILTPKKWARAASIAALSALAFTVLAMIIFQVGVSDVMDSYRRAYPQFYGPIYKEIFAIPYSSSLYGFSRALLGSYERSMLTEANSLLIARWCNLFSLILAVISAYVYLFKNLRVWEKAFLACVLILIVPIVSFDYKMLALYFPLILFFNEESEPGDRVMCVLLSLLFVPKAFVNLFDNVSISTIITPVLVLTVWALIVVRALKRRQELVPIAFRPVD